MDWNTLISVAIGGLIATIGSILNNRFQSKERDKDRQEQRREARMQAREKWIERDILQIMGMTENIVKFFGDLKSRDYQIALLESYKTSGLLTEQEANLQAKAIYSKVSNDFLEGLQLFNTIALYVYSFAEAEIISTYEGFALARLDSFRKPMDKETEKKDEEDWAKFIEQAGNFQKALREKLISIRE